MALCVCYPQHLFVLQLLVSLEVAGCFSNHYRYIEHFVLCFQLISGNNHILKYYPNRVLTFYKFIKQLGQTNTGLSLRKGKEQFIFFFIDIFFKTHNRCTLMTQPNSILQKKMCSYDPWLTRIFFQEVRTTFTFIDYFLYTMYVSFLSFFKIMLNQQVEVENILWKHFRNDFQSQYFLRKGGSPETRLVHLVIYDLAINNKYNFRCV